ncbi:MAG: hypothetical protein RLZZ422_330 [Pseudomonadota bacterium]|jgi:predicted nucleotidyltransferase component of viral defense system
MIETMLQRYRITDAESQYQALREIMQEITLAGLYRGNFFQKAAFYGGTALRIFYQLDRFSEDLDFSLLKENEDFSLEPYFNNVYKEFEALGITVEISTKQKTQQTAIESAFLKSDTSIHILQLKNKYQSTYKLPRPIKIKFEVDKKPPLGFETEEKLLQLPFNFHVKCFKIGDLYAGKLHALLYRKWKNRIKGRDWYDFEWYVKQHHPLHLAHFLKRAQQSGHLVNQSEITLNDVKLLLDERIQEVDFQQARYDIEPFIDHPEQLSSWSKSYFQQLVTQISVAT